LPHKDPFTEPSFVDNPSPAAPLPSPKVISRADEIIRTIANRMTEVFESSGSCFNKWRGHARSIEAQGFVLGAKRDFKIEMTVEEAQEIIDRFSGTLTLGPFLKMVGAGADSASAQSKAINSSQLDDNEKTLLHVARQAKGKDWEGVFDGASNVEQIVPSLKKLSIYVLGSDLRPCFTKYGKEGVVNKIQGFVSAL
jgi:hypothetical protein